MTRFPKRARTKADKRAAALAFVTWSEKPDAEKVASLVASYGFSEPDAREFVREQKVGVV